MSKKIGKIENKQKYFAKKTYQTKKIVVLLFWHIICSIFEWKYFYVREYFYSLQRIMQNNFFKL